MQLLATPITQAIYECGRYGDTHHHYFSCNLFLFLELKKLF